MYRNDTPGWPVGETYPGFDPFAYTEKQPVIPQSGFNPQPLPVTPKPASGKKGSPATKLVPASATAPLSPLPIQPIRSRTVDPMQLTSSELTPVYRPAPGTIYDKPGVRDSSKIPDFAPVNPPAQTTVDRGQQWFTAGDALQALEVASKFGQLVGGADVARGHYDNTPITKQVYDPRAALYQNQRSYSNTVSNIDTGNVNLRRGLQNQLYAAKLNADQQVISQYDQMNKGAQTQYEDRMSNQRRYNAQTNMTVDDLNQRNKDAYRNAVQNAFTSLGNFGESLNQKKQGTQSLAILKEMYGPVWDRFYSAMLAQSLETKQPQ